MTLASRASPRKNLKKLPIFLTILPHLSNYNASLKGAYRFIDKFPSYPNFSFTLRYIKVHLNQTFVSPGDNGGPLLFADNTYSGGFKLAGVQTSNGVMTDEIPGVGEEINQSFMEWEPIFIYKQWIKEMVEKHHTDL